MSDALGRFADGFMSWRRILAAVPAENSTARLTIFMNCCGDAANYVAHGLDRTVAADELTSIASAYNFNDSDAVQWMIGRAFKQIDDLREIAREEHEQQLPKPNGRAPLSLPSKADFIGGFVPPDYLIDNVLQRRFVYSLTGQTGHAKSALALLFAQLVASMDANSMLGVHKVHKGRVLYLVGENADDIRTRVIGADSRRSDDPDKDNLFFLPGVFDLGKMFDALRQACRRIGDFDLLIVDTSAAYFLGNEELNNVQMGTHARMLRRLTELPGDPCVLVLCHPIKYVTEPDQLLPRGGGAFLAEMDGNLTVWKRDEVMIDLHHNKMRGPGFEPLSFQLDRFVTDRLVDARGRRIPTVRAVPVSRTEEDRHSGRLREDEDRLLAAMLVDPNRSQADLAEACGWVNEKGEIQRYRAQRAIDRLSKSKPALIRKERDHWVLTEEGKSTARKAALAFERAKVGGQPELDLHS